MGGMAGGLQFHTDVQLSLCVCLGHSVSTRKGVDLCDPGHRNDSGGSISLGETKLTFQRRRSINIHLLMTKTFVFKKTSYPPYANYDTLKFGSFFISKKNPPKFCSIPDNFELVSQVSTLFSTFRYLKNPEKNAGCDTYKDTAIRTKRNRKPEKG